MRWWAPASAIPTGPVVRSQVNALATDSSLFTQNAAHKLQVFVEIARSLGRTLEVKPLLDKVPAVAGTTAARRS